ncbi:hypothetical protein [Bdellovibrio sp. HCB337]|uniref:hypothetical protein n=1 Tax=Bdellovibrio sp. HCB337 TaxID=3394358 RepID=UPI0039A623C6
MANHTSSRQSDRRLQQVKGSVLLTALGMSVFVCVMIMLSAIWIQSRIGQVMSSSNKMDHRIVLDGLFAYTINGIKQSWCFSPTWVQDNACDLHHARNTIRLLLSDETLIFLSTSKTPHPMPVEATRLRKITQSVNLASVTESHPLFGIVKPTGTNYNTVIFTVERDDSAISTNKGREVPLRIHIKLVANPNSAYKDLELQSKVVVYPRELSYFGLILPNNLYLGINQPPSVNNGDVAFGRVAASSTAGLRFESPIYVNGNVHLPAKVQSASQAMTNVVFLDKVVIGGGLVYQGTGQTLFNPPDAGGANNMYNHDLTSFSGLLAGFELDPERDAGLDKLFNINLGTPPTDFELCRKRVMASFDLSITRDTQLYSRFNSSPGPNRFDLSLNIGNIDNLIEQFPDSGGDSTEIATNVPGVNVAGKVNDWNGGAVLKVKVIYEGLVSPASGKNEVFFNTFFLPRDGQIELYPTGPGNSVITVTTKAHQVNGKDQFNQVNLDVNFGNPGSLNIGPYLSGTVLTQGSVKFVVEGMDYGYNYTQNIRNNLSTHPVMGPYKLNGFTFYKTGAGVFDIYRQTAGTWFNNNMLVDDPTRMPIYDPLQKPPDGAGTDWSAFDARCMTVPGSTDAFYTSFPSADWSVSFADQSRHAWSFDPDNKPNGYNNGTLFFDSGSSLYNPAGGVYPTFRITSLWKECSIEASANFVTGFYGCEKLTIKPRATPLRIIGTFIAGAVDIAPSAYQAGIRWSTIYHPQSVYEMRQARVLGKDKKGVLLNCSNPSLPPMWMPNIGAISALTHYNCNPVSLRTADPFKWTTVDPDCGVQQGQVKVSCKRAMTRFLIKEIGRTKGM